MNSSVHEVPDVNGGKVAGGPVGGKRFRICFQKKLQPNIIDFFKLNRDVDKPWNYDGFVAIQEMYASFSIKLSSPNFKSSLEVSKKLFLADVIHFWSPLKRNSS